MAAKKYRTVMLIDDNEIDNLINQKMIEKIKIEEYDDRDVQFDGKRGIT